MTYNYDDRYIFQTKYSDHNQYYNDLSNRNIIGQEQNYFSYLEGNNGLQTNYGNIHRNQMVNNPLQKRNKTQKNEVANKKNFENSNLNQPKRNINKSPMNIYNKNIIKNPGQNIYNINKVNIIPKKEIKKEIRAPNPVPDFQNNYNSNKININLNKEIKKEIRAQNPVSDFQKNYNSNKININLNKEIKKEIKAPNPVSDFQNNYNSNKINFNSKKEINKEINASNPVSDFNKDLLKVLIYIYFYEKYEKIVTDNKNKNIFVNDNKNNNFYLINPDWLKNLKKFYNYDKIQKNLESIGNNYNYNEIDLFIDNFVNILSKEEILAKDAVFPDDLKKVNKISTSLIKINDIIFTAPGIILPSKIMDIIKSWDENIKRNIKPKKFVFKPGLVYYINPNKIIVGNLDKSTALFTPKYIFAFNKNLESSESEQITKIPINDYIAQRKCKHEKTGQAQQLLNEEDQPIGTLFIMKENSPRPKSQQNYIQELNQNKKKISDLIKKNINLNNQIKILNNKLNEKNIENQNIKKELETLKQGNNSLNNNIQDINNEFDLKNKENEINQLKSKLKENQNTLNALNAKNKLLQKEIFDNKKYIENSKKKENNLLEEINKKNKEILNMKDIINKQNNYNKEINDLKHELKQKIDQIANIKKDFENLENKNKQLIQQNNDKELELNKIKLD